MKNFSKICTPAKIYFAIAVIGIIISLFSGVSIMYAFWKLIFAFIWTFVLGWFCDKGYPSISWFLVLLPYIFIVLGVLNIYHVSHEQRLLMRTIGLQGAYGQEAFVEGNRPRFEYIKDIFGNKKPRYGCIWSRTGPRKRHWRCPIN